MMHCEGCAASVKKAVKKIPGTSSISPCYSNNKKFRILFTGRKHVSPECSKHLLQNDLTVICNVHNPHYL